MVVRIVEVITKSAGLTIRPPEFYPGRTTLR